MKSQTNPHEIFPISGNKSLSFIKPAIKNPNIIVGDFTYFCDTDFEKTLSHHYDFYDDKLIIGKFCQISKNVHFIMNGMNHQMGALSTFPFYLFDGFIEEEILMSKGDTIIGNDVWIGENATILSGIHIGNGAIIERNSVVVNHVPPYSIIKGNPAKVERKRFDNELINLMENLKWWDLPIKEIRNLIPLLTNPNIEEVKELLKVRVLSKKKHSVKK